MPGRSGDLLAAVDAQFLGAGDAIDVRTWVVYGRLYSRKKTLIIYGVHCTVYVALYWLHGVDLNVANVKPNRHYGGTN